MAIDEHQVFDRQTSFPKISDSARTSLLSSHPFSEGNTTRANNFALRQPSASFTVDRQHPSLFEVDRHSPTSSARQCISYPPIGIGIPHDAKKGSFIEIFIALMNVIRFFYAKYAIRCCFSFFHQRRIIRNNLCRFQ